MSKKINNETVEFRIELQKIGKRQSLFVNNRRKKLLFKKSRAENHFKSLLKDAGIRFVREKIERTIQSDFSNKLYYTDFYIPKLNINIELDGKEHLLNKEYDSRKADNINKTNRSITIRYTNEEVLNMTKISIKDLKDKCFVDFKSEKNKNPVTRRQYGIWKLVEKKAKEKTSKINNNFNGIYDESINKSFIENDLTVFVRSSCPSYENYSPIKVFFKIFDNDKELMYEEIEITGEMFVSPQKSEVLSMTKALQAIYEEGGTDLKIKLYSHNKFIAEKMMKRHVMGDNNSGNIYTDSINDLYDIVELFTNLEFEWIPKLANRI